MTGRYAVGLHFGDASIEAMIANIRDGTVAADVTRPMSHDPSQEWLAVAGEACGEALSHSAISPSQIVAIGVACANHAVESIVSQLTDGRSGVSPGRRAGDLSSQAAEEFGLRPGIAVSGSITDVYAAVPGAGVAPPSTMVMYMHGRSSHLMMNSRAERLLPEIARVVPDGILPGYFGYELIDTPFGEVLPGQTEDRAAIESAAFRLRSICETLTDAGVPVRRFVACGEVPARSPLLMQTCADVLDARIKLAASDRPIALGAAILGCIAAGAEVTGHASISQAIHAMASQRRAIVYRPDLRARREYARLYEASSAANAALPLHRPAQYHQEHGNHSGKDERT